MKTYRLVITRTESFCVDVNAESEEKAMDLYYEGEASDEYGHKTFDTEILEVD